MGGIIIGIAILSCFTTAIVIFAIYNITKSSRLRDEMFHRYFIVDDLWLKTGSGNILTIEYSDKVVNIKVKCNYLAGTNDNCKVYTAFINDIKCATAVKLTDKYNRYYTFYVDEQFDEKEVWDILDTAYKKSDEQRKLEKESTKRSVLENNDNVQSN